MKKKSFIHFRFNSDWKSFGRSRYEMKEREAEERMDTYGHYVKFSFLAILILSISKILIISHLSRRYQSKRLNKWIKFASCGKSNKQKCLINIPNLHFVDFIQFWVTMFNHFELICLTKHCYQIHWMQLFARLLICMFAVLYKKHFLLFDSIIIRSEALLVNGSAISLIMDLSDQQSSSSRKSGKWINYKEDWTYSIENLC